MKPETRAAAPARLSRRLLLGGGAALLLAGPAPAAPLAPTPRQTAGPFYPQGWMAEADNDLMAVRGASGPAPGQVAHILGRVLGRDGRPLAGARLEIWQCDAAGRYHYPDREASGADPRFQGYGRATADADGAYRFRTLKPVPYAGRTPHIHFRLSGAGIAPFTTQMYLAGEPRNDDDFLFRRIADPALQERLLVELRPAPDLEPAALAGRFDIVVG